MCYYYYYYSTELSGSSVTGALGGPGAGGSWLGAFCSVCYSYMVHDRELVRSVAFLQAFVSVVMRFCSVCSTL